MDKHNEKKKRETAGEKGENDVDFISKEEDRWTLHLWCFPLLSTIILKYFCARVKSELDIWCNPHNYFRANHSLVSAIFRLTRVLFNSE